MDQGSNNISVVVWATYANKNNFFSSLFFIVCSLKLVMKVVIAILLVVSMEGERAKHDKERGITWGLDEEDN